MNENVSLSTYEEYCSFEQQYMQPQKVPAGCSFWMIRSKRGVFYDEYIKCGYIAIGWNALLKQDFSTDTEDQKKNKIAIAYPSEQRPTGCVNKCDRFINEMKRGDIAVVVGNGRVSFCIVGDYYEEHIENAVLRELEANAQMEASNYKDYDIPCPYQKRRYIRCIREVAEDNITPILGKAISNRHMSFKKNLKILRKGHGLTQEQLGEILHVSRTAISNYENGKMEPSISMLLNLSKFFEVSVDQLLR